MTRLAFGVLFLALGLSSAAAQHAATPLRPEPADPAAMGEVDAPVSIVAFVDLECPFSAATVPVLEAMAKAHPGQVHLQLRQFPLNQHAEAILAHEAALAAGAQGRYFAMADLIQANQKLMSREQYLHYARSLHLDLVRFTADLDRHRFLPQIRSEVAEGNALGVTLTPTLYVNGRQATGAMGEKELAELVRRVMPTGDPASQPPVLADETSPVVSPDLWKQMLAGDPVALGPSDAPVTIVEFTDFQCPFCRRATDPLHQLVASSGGKIRLVYRSFPLDIHDQAQLAAEAALAAGAQGRFWPLHDLLFAQQDVVDRAHIDGFARQLGLDLDRFHADLASGAYRGSIAADRVLGNEAGVDGTPSFFINGHPLTGARTLPEFQQAVALATSAPAAASTPRIATNVRSPDHLIAGTSSSSNSIVWFSDVEAAAAPAIGHVIQKLLEQQGDQLRVALKSYALPGHPRADLTHRALLAAAAQDHFWPFYYLLAGQALPKDETGARTRILTAAKTAGLDLPRFTEALDRTELEEQMEADRAEAVTRGVRGVPVLFLNGKRVDGVQPLALYEDYLHAEQAEAETK